LSIHTLSPQARISIDYYYDPSSKNYLTPVQVGRSHSTRIMGQGVSQNVYLANASGQDNFAMAALKPEWVLADVITAGAMTVLLDGVGEFAAVVDEAELPSALSSLDDLFGYLKVAVQFISKASSTTRNVINGAQSLVNAFQNVSYPIAFNDYKDVASEDFLKMYLTPSGIAGMTGTKTASLLVMSGDGKQLAMWSTGSDESWITTDQQTIVRSKYGTIWQQDPGSGTEVWSDIFSA